MCNVGPMNKPKAKLYYHPKKKDFMIQRVDETGVSTRTGHTCYRSPGPMRYPCKFGWKLIGELKSDVNV